MAASDARGVLFDVDGTLVDSTYLHAVSWAEALRQQGHDVPMVRAHRAIGMATGQLLDHLLGPDRDDDEQDVLSNAHLSLYRQHWGRLVPLPGAAALLHRCAAAGLRVVLASSAADTELAWLRAVIGADDAVTAATSASDVESGKPAPDILEVALERGGLRAGNAVLVGDSVWDGVAARRAGVPFVAVTCGGTGEAELRRAGAVEVWDFPADLVDGFARSRLARLGRPT